MEEEKYQRELFEFTQPKKSFSRFSDILPKADFEGRVNIVVSLEKLVFISIGVIMAMVVVYALGVEAGRAGRKVPTVAQAAPQRASPVAFSSQESRVAAIPARNILNTAPVASMAAPAASAKRPAQSHVRPAGATRKSKPLVILACTFARRENAETARSILAGQGFNVTVVYGQPYYRVCVGTNADDAQKDLARVRRIYKDAMMKPM